MPISVLAAAWDLPAAWDTFVAKLLAFLPTLLSALLILLVAFLVTKLLPKPVNSLMKRTRLDQVAVKYLHRANKIVVWALAIVMAMDKLGFPVGSLLAVLAAVVWAVYSLLTKQIGGYGWNVIQTTRRIFGWGILFMIPAAAVMDFRLGLERLSEPSYVGMFLYLGLGACAACFVTWNFAIKTLGPIKTMVYIYLVPVITVVCSVLILREVVTPMSAGGTLLTLVGLALSQWDSLKQLRGRRGQEASSEKDLEAKP